jgi:hypothetical protein
MFDYANGLYKKYLLTVILCQRQKPEMWGLALYRKFNKPSRQKLPTALF